MKDNSQKETKPPTLQASDATPCSASFHPRTDDAILAGAMDRLAESIVSQDGVANQAMREAGHRIEELSDGLEKAVFMLDVFRGCILTKLLPEVESECFEQLTTLLNELDHPNESEKQQVSPNV